MSDINDLHNEGEMLTMIHQKIVQEQTVPWVARIRLAHWELDTAPC